MTGIFVSSPHGLKIFRELDLQIRFPVHALTQGGADTIREARAIMTQKQKIEARLQKQITQAKAKAKALSQYSWGLLLLFTAGAWWVRRTLMGRADSRSLVIRYEAPPGLSLLQLALLLDKRADDRDFPAAILELASLGIIRIDKEGESAVLRKILNPHPTGKEPLSADQQSLIDALFSSDDVFTFKNRTSSQRTTLSHKLKAINYALYRWARETGYARNNFRHSRALWLLPAIGMVLTLMMLVTIVCVHNRFHHACFLYVGAALLPAIIAAPFSRLPLWSKLSMAVGGMGALLLFLSRGLFSSHMDPFHTMDALLNPLLPATLAGIMVIDTYRRLGRLMPKGYAVIQHLKGLETFMHSVKEDEIRRCLADDPRYLERLLPYAILFGQTKHWLTFYLIASIQTTQWHHGDIGALSDLSDGLISSVMTPSAGTSGGYSGGGYGEGSSGGGGGGGGGSW